MGSDAAVNDGGREKTGPKLVAATVIDERPSAIYELVLENQQKVLAHLVGAVQRNFVRLVPGDRVEVELMPQDPTRGRITRKI